MKRTMITVAFVALAIPLSACGSSNMSSMKATTAAPAASIAAGKAAFNDPDTTFAEGMIPHHEQAIEMADMALDPSAGASAKITALAKAVKAAQDPEIATMKGWLTAWGKAPSGGMAGMDHSTTAMPGMMSAADMTTLGIMKAAAFDKAWATMMIAHHKGAIDMAKTVIKNGASADVKTLATAMIKGQQTEIDQMTALLKG